MSQFETVKQGAGAQRRRVREQPAGELMLANAERGDFPFQAAIEVDVGRAGAGEIALVGIVGTLFVINPLNQFGDQEVDVRVALPVGVAARVYWHTRDVGGEVCAVVQVEAAQEILVGLAFAAVLGDDQARHKFQNLAGPQRRPVLDQLVGDRALTCRVRGTDAVIVMALDLDFFQLVLAVGVGG